MRNRKRPISTRSRFGRRRVLAFERLDARTVLSTTLPLASGFLMPHDSFGTHAPQGPGHDAPRFDGAGPNGFSFGSSPLQRIDGFVHNDGLGGRSPYEVGGHGPNDVGRLEPIGNAPVVSAFEYEGEVYFVQIAGGAGYVFFGFSDPPAAMLPSSPSHNFSAESADSMSSALASGIGAQPLFAVSKPDVNPALPANATGGGDKASVAQFVSRPVSTIDSGMTASAESISGSRALQNAGGVLFVLPDRASLSPAVEYRVDGQSPAPGAQSDESVQLPQFDSEGGLIELEPLDRNPGSDTLAGPLDDEPNAPRPSHRGTLADDAKIWNDILDALDDQLADESTDEPDAESDEPPGTADDVARFDDGGMIELAVGALPGEDAAPAVNQSDRPTETMEVTIDVGIALFQAFELSTESNGSDAAPVAPVVDPPPVAEPAGESLKASAEENEQPPGRVAAGVGLGLLAALPLARRNKQSQPLRAALRMARRMVPSRRR